MFERISLSEQAEAALKKEIISGRLQPGEKINAEEFKKAWEISSTPFRDAVRVLEAQGFLIVVPRKGIYVYPLDVASVREIFDLRIALEGVALERATPLIPKEKAARVLATYKQTLKDCKAGKTAISSKIDRLVHELAWNYCGNKRLQTVLSSHMELIHWVQGLMNRKQPAAYRNALPEHIRIMDAVVKQDATAAALAMRQHLENSRERLCTEIELKSAKE